MDQYVTIANTFQGFVVSTTDSPSVALFICDTQDEARTEAESWAEDCGYQGVREL